jgi:type IV secretion system protein VirB2
MTFSSLIRPIATSGLRAAAIVAILVEPAFAQAAGIENVLQNIVDLLTGNIFRLLAIISVVVISFACMFGYVDLRKAGYWIVGVGVITGATELVNAVVGG